MNETVQSVDSPFGAIKKLANDPGILIPDRPIAFNRDFVRLGIKVNGALFLSQAIYWSKRTKDENGWFYKTIEEWEDETGLTTDEQRGIKANLLKKGYIEIEKRGAPARNFYRVDLYSISLDLVNSHDQCREIPTTSDGEFPRHTYTETTTESTQERVISKNSKGEDISSVPASDYQPDGWSPRKRLEMKRRAERVLGIRKTNSWSQLLFGSAWDFKKAYKKFQGVDYVGEIFVDEVARKLATWYEAGETRETIRGLIVGYFQSEKAERLAITPNACFSDHTYNSWKQGKLSKIKTTGVW